MDEQQIIIEEYLGEFSEQVLDYVFDCGVLNVDGSLIIPVFFVDRWKNNAEKRDYREQAAELYIRLNERREYADH